MNEFPDDAIDEVEVVDGLPVADTLPVLAEVRELEPVEPSSVSVVQAAAMTAGGFFAGALAMALVKGLAARRAEELAATREFGPAWPSGTSRTYLVNVRIVSRRPE